MVSVKRILQRELNNNCPLKFQRDNVSKKEYIDAIQHSATLKGHLGCVNTICWNKCGSMLASGSDDKSIILWGDSGHQIQQIKTLHKDNIFSVVFVPESEDRLLLSASGDRSIFLHDLNHLGDSQVQDWSNCNARVKRLAVADSEPRLFWSACEDGILREHDIRNKKAEDLIDLTDESYQIKSLAINPNCTEMIAVALNDSMVPIFDRRFTKTPLLRLLPGHLSLYEQQKRRILRSALVTHLAFNAKGDEILVNISSDNLYVFNIRENSTESSPNVLNALNNLLSPTAEMEQQMNHLRQSRKKEVSLFSSIRSVVKKLIKERKFSKAIDLCSTTIDTYLRENRITPVFFHHSPSARTITKNCSFGFANILLQRGIGYMKRNWDGDAMCALRDFLQCLEIDSQKKEANYWIVAALLALKQNDLARKFYEMTNSHLRNHKEKFEKLLEKYEDVPPLDAWSSQRYNDFNDYIERYCGATNFNTDIKEANWFGGHDEMIVAGSDCGNLYIWERTTQKILRLFHADEYSVNCVQSHPNRLLLASSGIEPVIRLWEPTLLDENQKEERVDKGDSTVGEDGDKRDLTSQIYDVISSNRDPSFENIFFDTTPRHSNFFLQHVFGHDDDEGEEQQQNSHRHHPPSSGTVLCRTM